MSSNAIKEGPDMALDHDKDNGGVFRRRRRVSPPKPVVHFMTPPNEIPPHQRVRASLEPLEDGMTPIYDESGFIIAGIGPKHLA